LIAPDHSADVSRAIARRFQVTRVSEVTRVIALQARSHLHPRLRVGVRHTDTGFAERFFQVSREQSAFDPFSPFAITTRSVIS
jgi:hypothetical protein